jgi:hypothetical protein
MQPRTIGDRPAAGNPVIQRPVTNREKLHPLNRDGPCAETGAACRCRDRVC